MIVTVVDGKLQTLVQTLNWIIGEAGCKGDSLQLFARKYSLRIILCPLFIVIIIMNF